MNDIYHNLAKFLTRNFCKNFKLRRSMSGKRVMDSSRETKNRLNLLFKNMRSVSSPQPPPSLPSTASATLIEPSSSSSISTRHHTQTPPPLSSDRERASVSSERSSSNEPRYFSHMPPTFSSIAAQQQHHYHPQQQPQHQASPLPPRSRTVSNSAVTDAATTTSVSERMSRSNTNLNDLTSTETVSSNNAHGFFDDHASVSIDQFFPGGSSSCRSSIFDINISMGKFFLYLFVCAIYLKIEIKCYF